MARGKELAKNTGILLVAKISTQFVNFLLIPFYTGLLTTEEYGEIDIYTSLAMIIVPFLTLQLEMGIFRFFLEAKRHCQKSTIITTAFVMIGRILLFVSLLYMVCICFVPLKHKVLLYAYYLTISIMTILQQVCRAYGDDLAYGTASFLSSSVTVVLNVFFIYGLGMKVEGVLGAAVSGNLIGICYMLITTRVFNLFDTRYYSKECRKKLLDHSVPLVFNQISSWVINHSDRVIILIFWGTSFNGIYSLANKFSNITNTFFGVYNLAWTESVIRSKEDIDREEYITAIFSMTYKLYLALVTAIVELLPFCFSILVNSDYSAAYGHIPILLLSMFFSGMAAMIGSVYIAYGKTKEVSITTVMAGGCNIIVHFFLLSPYKLYAASISTLVSFSLLFIYRYIFVKRFFDLRADLTMIASQIGIYIFSWIAYAQKNVFLAAIAALMNSIYCVKLFRGYKPQLAKIFRR